MEGDDISGDKNMQELPVDFLVYHVYMIIRHDLNNKKYLYDVINIKKETSNPLGC